METTVDPVCGMEVDPATAAGSSEYQGQTYYFCSTGCKRQFEKDPQRYMGAREDHEPPHDH
jgi:Cu+-exporting ATPase